MRSSKHGIIIAGTPSTKADFESLAKEHVIPITFINPPSRADSISAFEKLAAEGKYDAVIFSSGQPHGPVNEELLASLKGKLRYVGGQGAGFDHVDTSWLDSADAWYTNTPEAVADPTATTTIMLILQCLKHASQQEMSLRRGDWRKGLVPSPDVRDYLVGVIGMGTIGKLVRDKCQALGMRVIYNNRRRLPEEEEHGAKYVSFEELLKQSQLITLNCPLNDETHHLLSTNEFDMMTKGVMIVNTSRGPVIDEEALVAALKSGKVDRAGLDVYENEPEVHPYLMTCERCSLLPHWGGFTTRSRRDGEVEALANLKEWVATGRPKNGVNRPVGQAGG